MKKTFILLLFFAFLSVNAQTTDDEYNYMTKGFKIEQESGLDKKQGYDFDKLPIMDDGNYTFEFTVLKRSASKDVAGIICKAYSKNWGNTYYLGIPVGNLSLIEKYNASLASWDRSILQAYSKYTSVLFAAMTNQIYLLDKKK